MRLPKWTEDELILTLYLYHEIKRGEKKNSHSAFAEMSKKLRDLNLFPEHQDDPTFRNCNGVSRKLGNFASIDPDNNGKGLYACSHMDRSIFMQFYNQPSDLKHAVEQVNKKYSKNKPALIRLPWTDEELILTLALYNTLTYGQMHGHNPNVIALSQILQNLPIYNNITRPENFRSISSVSLRLSNFRSCDPKCKARGMRSSGTGLFRDIFHKYYNHPELLANEVKKIEQKYEINIQEILSTTKITRCQDVAQEELPDNRTLLELHKSKEVESFFYTKVKNYHYSQSKTCSLCGRDLSKIYGRLGEDMMEYHCIKNANNTSSQKVTIGDYIQVCPTCHKLLDRYIGLVDYDDIRKITEI